ncbi:MAG TPA: hypothetical protein VH333_20770 [Pseudonocardiaceae bacterium]|nr:hypothetical protein [Pseudonocardiaceae bacterium]
MSGAEILFAVVSGLAINEFCDVSPWLAQKLVRWSARRLYTDPGRAEELAALIEERPGKLFKLLTALSFTIAAVAHRCATRRRSLSTRFFLGQFGRAMTAGFFAFVLWELATALALVMENAPPLNLALVLVAAMLWLVARTVLLDPHGIRMRITAAVAGALPFLLCLGTQWQQSVPIFRGGRWGPHIAQARKTKE